MKQDCVHDWIVQIQVINYLRGILVKLKTKRFSILTCSQISAKDFGSDCALVHSFTDKEIKDAQIRDPDLSGFIELFNGHTEKPKAKLLAGKSSEVKILCSLWKQFKIVDGILYRVGKTDIDLWRLIIPRSIRT